MILLVGVLVIALGLLSGGALVLAALGVLDAQPGVTLWITYPLLCVFGFMLVAAQAKSTAVRSVSLVSSGVLLLLALASVAALILGAANLVSLPASAASLWFVFAVGAVFGAFGAASFGRAAEEA